MTLQESMWNAKEDRLAKAHLEADKAADITSAHSIMLSAYLTVLAEGPSTLKKLHYTICAIWRAVYLIRDWERLNHNQLDVLIQFCLALRSKIPFVRSGQRLEDKWFPWFHELLLRLANRELTLAYEAKPHQRALAYLTFAETTYAVNFNKNGIEAYIAQALNFEEKIKEEEDRLLALRQLVRIKRKTAELCLKKEMYGSKPEVVRPLLNEALALAEGEADTADQAKRIRALLAQI